MEIEKIGVPKSLTFSKSEIDKIALEIQALKFQWEYTPLRIDNDYWLITVSPNGEIILPDSETVGHPKLATLKIYPINRVLGLLYDYFCPKDSDNELLMSTFMIYYGYINIDGYINKNEIKCIYNPEALTLKTIALPNSMRAYSEMADITSIEYNDVKGIKLARKVPFFRNEILKLTKGNTSIECINDIIGRSKKAKKKALDEINERYNTMKQAQRQQ